MKRTRKVCNIGDQYIFIGYLFCFRKVEILIFWYHYLLLLSILTPCNYNCGIHKSHSIRQNIALCFFISR